jgi:hypothetical protein
MIKGQENLIPAKKGEIRNPKGKPKGTKNLKTLIREVLDATDVQINGKKVKADYAIVAKLVQTALQGNLKAVEMIHDRMEGKPTQKQETELKVGDVDKVNRLLDDLASSDQEDSQ